jgi:hypothetical protein
MKCHISFVEINFEVNKASYEWQSYHKNDQILTSFSLYWICNHNYDTPVPKFKTMPLYKGFRC